MRKVSSVPAVLVLAVGCSSGRSTEATIRVIAHDYALEAPDSIRARQVTLEFANQGKKDHELFVGLLRPGMGGTEIAAAHQKGLNFRQLSGAYLDGPMSGLLYASPGTASPARLTIPVTPGRSYVLLCQLRDTVGMPQHAALGMFRVLRVQEPKPR